jgi:CRISPR/Cas system CSM-associated protein Csm3 (group 7 of RAMP superfamily)
MSAYKLKVITPLHIGNDNALSPATYAHMGDKINVFKTDDLIKVIQKIEDVFNTKTQSMNLATLIPRDTLSRLKPYLSLKVWSQGENVSNKEIELSIRENNELYIPGSSIKGAIMHAIEIQNVKQHRSIQVKDIHNSLAITDAYFTNVSSHIERGYRITTNKSVFTNTKKVRQDNYKEWIKEGSVTKNLNLYFRSIQHTSWLLDIFEFSHSYLNYQLSFFNFLYKNNQYKDRDDLEDLENVIAFLNQVILMNTKEEPILILGRNTHKFSKSNDLLKSFSYDHAANTLFAEKVIARNGGVKPKMIKFEHPISRLLVMIEKDNILNIPGIVKFIKS